MLRFGAPKLATENYRDRPGAYGVILGELGVLLTHQISPIPEFQLPGGGIDKGEPPLQALYREIAEETGWSCQVERKLGVYCRYTFMPEYDLYARKICHIYVLRAGRSLGPPSERGHYAIWANAEAALDMIASEGDRYFLGQFLLHN
ncbi:NUDIX hydrolase [Amylibacter marinus]|uniref:NUDIX hydrolase n=1 Tax=Amylibacter marinus TaxID=1475483 RepID=A0ABQ5VVQ3_9RHOB|nr:NUDIX domain-containing protein [Amylibacter marinus]GLQ35379.1 NUDIX hydrolase [Amylibacter marinus]